MHPLPAESPFPAPHRGARSIALRLVVLAGVLAAGAVTLVAAGFARTRWENRDLVNRWIRSGSGHGARSIGPETYAALPSPVRKYFEYAFNGQTTVDVRLVEWSERGDFLLPVGRFTSRSVQTSRTDRPVFAWCGTFSRAGIPFLESRDAFSIHRHDMRAKLLAWRTVMRTDYTRREELKSLYSGLMLRYYGQALVMPWTLLPSEYVEWEPVDEAHAFLSLRLPGFEGRYLATFASDGRITRMETDRLFLEGNDAWRKETGQKLDYRVVNGFRVPTRMDYTWTLEDGTLDSHYDFEISEVRFER